MHLISAPILFCNIETLYDPGLRIAVLENLGPLKNQCDTLNLCDNDIRIVSNFPQLPRLRSLLLSNNRIIRIDADLCRALPFLTTLILTNNQITELGDLDALAGCTELNVLSLLGNPVIRKKDYRLYTIYRIPSLRVLDFQRIRDKV
jgi:U2 small nuclear ribonucleoprotein A'